MELFQEHTTFQVLQEGPCSDKIAHKFLLWLSSSAVAESGAVLLQLQRGCMWQGPARMALTLTYSEHAGAAMCAFHIINLSQTTQCCVTPANILKLLYLPWYVPAADELASALQLESGPFTRRYHFEPPNRALDVFVLHSRACSRAQWAAQLCLDAGCK